MSKAKPETEPAPPRKLVKQVADEVEARMSGPQPGGVRLAAGAVGAVALPADLGKRLKAAIPHFLTTLMTLGAVGADGKVSADEAKEIAASLYELYHRLSSAPPPSPAA